MRFLKVKPQYTSSYVLKMNKTELSVLLDELLDSGEGETFTLEVVEMTDDEFDDLDEFETIKTDYEMNSFEDYEEDDEED